MDHNDEAWARFGINELLQELKVADPTTAEIEKSLQKMQARCNVMWDEMFISA